MLKFLFLSTLLVPLTALVNENPDELLDWCIASRNHKTKPGPEDILHKQCKPWQSRSCCTTGTTVSTHYSKMYNFDWNHCSHVRSLSEKCREHFIQDLCFYECSPNVGPWVVTVDQQIRKERFVEVPICATDCDNWFEDCSADYTCTDNWGRNFDWIDRVNKCPAGSSCTTFKEIYKTSKNFCERVWDHSWKYTSNDKPCMRLWFNGTSFNPNDAVAKWKVQQIKKKLDLDKSTAALGHKASGGLTIVILTASYILAVMT